MLPNTLPSARPASALAPRWHQPWPGLISVASLRCRSCKSTLPPHTAAAAALRYRMKLQYSPAVVLPAPPLAEQTLAFSAKPLARTCSAGCTGSQVPEHTTAALSQQPFTTLQRQCPASNTVQVFADLCSFHSPQLLEADATTSRHCSVPQTTRYRQQVHPAGLSIHHRRC
jgi:hypothetical protein